jgi:hypothetical protein
VKNQQRQSEAFPLSFLFFFFNHHSPKQIKTNKNQKYKIEIEIEIRKGRSCDFLYRTTTRRGMARAGKGKMRGKSPKSAWMDGD